LARCSHFTKNWLCSAFPLCRALSDNGTLKTRTLNKYLRADSLPQNPRYPILGKSLAFVAGLPTVAGADRTWLLRIAAIYESL